MELAAALIVLGHVCGVVVLGWLYFRRYQVARPPIGIFNLADVAIVLCGVVVVPVAYLTLPLWLVGGLLAIGALGALSAVLEPIVRSRGARWATLCAVAVTELWLAAGDAAAGSPLPTINNVVVGLVALGIANLWAQSGLRARDAALLGAALAVYDVVATSWLPLMGDLFSRVAALPFAPLVSWPISDDAAVGIGLGDLLVATLFPLVMRKAYGRAAGLTALGLGIGGIVVAFLVTGWAALAIFPVMVVLGPLMVVQYGIWGWQRGPERTTWHYLQDEPLEARPVRPACAL